MEVTNNQARPITLEAITATRVSVVAPEKGKTVDVTVQRVDATENSTQDKKEQLQDAVSQINDHVQNLQRSLQFIVDEESGKDIVIVSDVETKEVIRQYPSEEVLEIARQIVAHQQDAVSLFSSSI